MGLLGNTAAAYAGNHINNGMYHGIHQGTDNRGKQYYHVWNHHSHGEKYLEGVECHGNTPWTLDCVSDVRCSADGTIKHVHCQTHNNGRDVGVIGQKDPSEGPSNPQCQGTDDYGFPTYQDGHGTCDHFMFP